MHLGLLSHLGDCLDTPRGTKWPSATNAPNLEHLVHRRILFIDDFLADGHASGSIIHLCRQSGAQIVGMGFLVEKGFAQGGQFLRDHNIPYHALATITRINEDGSMDLQ